ncbi:hypothetical protein [Methylobacterium iners]|uniref:hypothetical protein n=1 Tax=Methylobacterium iners TaxID=418707 RepID=UPI001EE3979F|nr:hypothetical protein [Methylobacterium iners]
MAEMVDVPVGQRYLIVLPVLDYIRLSLKDDDGRIGLLNVSDVQSLIEGRALLILDLSNEGPTYDREIFDSLHRQLAVRGVPMHRVVFVSQNRLLSLEYRRYHNDGIVFWQSEFFVQTIANWLSEHDSQRLFGSKAFERADYSPLRAADAPSSFMCQNAAVRWHRVLIYRWLTLRGFSSEGMVSFYGIGPDNSKANEIDIYNPPDEIKNEFGDLVAGIEDWIPRRAEKMDASVGSGNDLVLTLDVKSYAYSDLSIVTESDFFVPGIERVTEKAVKAAAMGVPFIIVGAPRSVQRLAEMGFCTFDGLIDQSYDLVDDPLKRLRALFKTIESGWERCRSNPAAWRNAARDQALANFHHGKGGLVKRLDQLLTMPMLSRMSRFIEEGDVVG